MSTIRIISMLTGLCLLAFVGSVSAANAPHYGSLVVCSSCHTTHNAAGPSLTTVAGNANLCMSCHFSGGIAGEKPFLTSMQPSGDFKTSHSWSGVMPNSANDQGANNPYGLRTDDQVADTKLKAQLVKYGNCSNGVDGSKKACESVGSCSKSTYLTQATCTANGTCIPTTYKTQAACSTGGGVWTPYTWTPHTPGTWTAAVVCSTCHAVMAQANAPWDPFATPSVSGVATGGSKTTVIDNSKTWTENQWEGYYVRVPNTVSGSIQVIGSNTANTLNLTTGAAFGTAVASGSTYGIQAAGKHFMRAKNDLSQMCEDCHYYRSATQISDVKTYNGSKKSHPVVKNISSDPADPSLFVGV
ncbi:MAG: cytochrome c3 family protein, partial [Nitrospirae bacterium]|nr:cytochrome c3 family protein [Nitrospirota bacterium]